MIGSASLRQRLRETTSGAHERQHHHPGFAAAARGAISIEEYRLLLFHLLGFHRAFERAIAVAHEFAGDMDFTARARGRLIEADLATLGLGPSVLAGAPLCKALSPPRSEGELLGALYVVEGSTLGGALIAKALEPVTRDARRFYLGYGASSAQMWRAFLLRLERLEGSPAQDAAVLSAQGTFNAFEIWMNGWKDAPLVQPSAFDGRAERSLSAS